MEETVGKFWCKWNLAITFKAKVLSHQSNTSQFESHIICELYVWILKLQPKILIRVSYKFFQLEIQKSEVLNNYWRQKEKKSLLVFFPHIFDETGITQQGETQQQKLHKCMHVFQQLQYIIIFLIFLQMFWFVRSIGKSKYAFINMKGILFQIN